MAREWEELIENLIIITILTFPESTTYTTSLMVMLVSAIFVAKICEEKKKIAIHRA